MGLAFTGNTSISGIQFGDEGKGQIVDFLSGDYDFVVRYNGGANAGHSVVIGESKHALHLVPSGILRSGTVNVVANGVVIDPAGFLEEIEDLRSAGVVIGPENLMVSERSHVVMPYHKDEDELLDRAMAAVEGQGSLLETTKRGIGPCYADKSYRSTAIRMVDLLDPRFLDVDLPRILRIKQATIAALADTAGVPWPGIDEAALRWELSRLAAELAPFVKDTRRILADAVSSGRRILFEGANASLLDIDFGTYPFVTSSNCTSLGVYNGTGLPGGVVSDSIGVAKLYMSRVGAGPFPTEIEGDEAATIREAAGEFGTTTGRPRRIGHLDLVALRHAAAINGTTGLALTGMAFLSGVDPIRVCTAYRYRGQVLQDFPANPRVLAEVEPVFKELPGFHVSVGTINRLADLPAEAHRLIETVVAGAGVPVVAVCVGKERSQVLID